MVFCWVLCGPFWCFWSFAARVQGIVPPDMGLAPSTAGGPSPPPPPPLHPGPLRALPPPQTGPPRPGALQKESTGVGGRERKWAGRKGIAIGGKGLPIAMGEGGGPSKHQLGPDPHLGAPKGSELRWAKSCDSYRRIASESYRCDSHH